LEKPYHLDYASQNLCDMLGYTATEIHNLFEDKYSQMVYEPDRPKFLKYIQELATKEQTLTLRYRMVCKDGHIIHLHDTMTSTHLEDGKMYGFAVVADVTSSAPRYLFSNSQILLSRLIGSYGFLRCTCEKYPKITYMNDHMRKYLHITQEGSNWKDFLQENIFFMIPLSERDYFHTQLDQAYHSTEPVNIEHQIVRSDGSRILLTGWINMFENDYGEREYAITYMNMGKNRLSLLNARENSYFNALKNAYNLIFEINLVKNTVECIHGRETSEIGAISDINMTIDSAINFWLNNYILEGDREMMRAYLTQVTTPGSEWNDSNVLQTEFRLRWTNQVIHHFLVVSVKLDSSTVLFCCRDISNLKYMPPQNREGVVLGKWSRWLEYFMKETDQSTLGMGILEEKEGAFSLLYLSESILSYLGIQNNDYLRSISGEYPMNQVLERTSFTNEQFQELVTEKQLLLLSHQQGDSNDRMFRLVCKVYPDENSSLYEVLVYEDQIPTKESEEKQIFARTFGHFDLFVNQLPVTFSSTKEKELMALLIDRNGGTLSPGEAISYLWEDEKMSEKVSARYRKLAMGLKKTLKKYGIESILINNHGVRSVDVSAIKCDYYELLAGNKKYQHSFHNAYMTDYSWAEETLATLWDYS
jgi:PAS domain S-box-containing protein